MSLQLLALVLELMDDSFILCVCQQHSRGKCTEAYAQRGASALTQAMPASKDQDQQLRDWAEALT